MSGTEPWISLGLAPTSDIRAIRSAYAGKLKQIDVDADPESFRALRERHDWAVHLAYSMSDEPNENGLSAAHCQEEAAALETVDDSPDVLLASAAVDDHISGDSFQAMEQLRSRIWQLLTDEKYGPWHAERLAAETRALVELPILENIDVTAETEHWLGTVIAQTVPRSDPMVAIVVRHFGWERLEGKVGGFYGLHHALQRLKDIDCSARLRQADHRWHQAFLYLQQPSRPSVSADEKRKIGNHINSLLESIRFHNPTVEAELDAEHVAQWDGFIGQAIEQKQEIAPIKPSVWQNTFGLIPVWGWFVIFYIFALIFGG